MSIDAMKQALEALQGVSDFTERQLVPKAIAALRLAIEQAECIKRAEEAFAAASEGMKGEQAEKQEPVKHQDWCASLTQLLLSYPPKPAPCNCAPPQQEKQAPVADTLIRKYVAALVANVPDAAAEVTKAMVDYCYTAPPQRQPLTEDEIALISAECALATPSDIYFARAIERKHGIGGGE
jgi:hypothetical protein